MRNVSPNEAVSEPLITILEPPVSIRKKASKLPKGAYRSTIEFENSHQPIFVYDNENSYLSDREQNQWNWIYKCVLSDYVLSHGKMIPVHEHFIWPREFIAQDGQKWRYLNHGSYNIAYRNVNPDGTLGKKVYKISFTACLEEGSLTDLPARCVLLWNRLNPDFYAYEYEEGWVAPYIEGRNATTEEICHWLVDTNDLLGRLLLDPFVNHGEFDNFRCIETPQKKEKIICIDMGGLVRLDPEFDKSQSSLDFWHTVENKYHEKFISTLNLNSETKKIFQTLKALLCIEFYYPDVECKKLKTDPVLVNLLAQHYDAIISDKNHQIPHSSLKQYLKSEAELAKNNPRAKFLFDYGFRDEQFRLFFRKKQKYSYRILTELQNSDRLEAETTKEILSENFGQYSLNAVTIQNLFLANMGWNWESSFGFWTSYLLVGSIKMTYEYITSLFQNKETFETHPPISFFNRREMPSPEGTIMSGSGPLLDPGKVVLEKPN